MPIYEYQCEECGHELEAMQRMSDSPLKDCPQCGKPGLRKLVSASAFRLKGGGWYETDFKDKKQKNVVKKDEQSSGAGASNSGESGASASEKKVEETTKSDKAKSDKGSGTSASTGTKSSAE